MFVSGVVGETEQWRWSSVQIEIRRRTFYHVGSLNVARSIHLFNSNPVLSLHSFTQEHKTYPSLLDDFRERDRGM